MAKQVEILDALKVAKWKYQEQRSKGLKSTVVDPRTGQPRQSREGALLGNRLRDGAGLYLYCSPSNSKSWRFDYRFAGARRVLVYASFPDMSLADARIAHREARALLAKGIDPAEERKRKEAEAVAAVKAKQDDRRNTFVALATEWKKDAIREADADGKPKSTSWHDNITRWLEWVNEDIGSKPVKEIAVPDVLAVLKKIERRGHRKTAAYVRSMIASILDYGISESWIESGFNPAASLRKKYKVPAAKHHPTLKLHEIPALLAAIDGYQGPEAVKIGMRLLLHTFPRNVELAETRWTEIHFDAAEFHIPKERMKAKRDHFIPLSRQAIQMLTRLKELAGDSPYVFPGLTRRDQPMRKRVFNAAFNAIGYRDRFSPHSARGTAASILAEAGWDKNIVDAQLAHAEINKTRASYFHNVYVAQRKELMQAWSDMIDAACSSNVFPINAGKAA
jgi:integrase